jgi:hypothetical protein
MAIWDDGDELIAQMEATIAKLDTLADLTLKRADF